MISVIDAIKTIRERTAVLPPVKKPLQQAAGLVLAEDVFALVSIPAFHQSAMDGYAFRFADYQQKKELYLSGEVAAGDDAIIPLAPQQAVRIFTGAPVPEGLDTVVMQEKTEVAGNRLLIHDAALASGSNVRKKGDEINAGEMALAKGTLLSPAAVGFLAGMGITTVPVYPRPVVHIITTGKELAEAGTPLQPGQVYESNSLLLQAALQQLHCEPVTITRVGDDLDAIVSALNLALAGSDLLLLTGGVSVGDYDFVLEATKACGVQPLFHKVAQRPGKPLYAGCKEGKVVFGLPGNPASVLTCFYNYVIPAIEALTGREPLLEKRSLPLLAGFPKKIALTQFLKAYATADGVRPLGAQDSFRLRSFAVANCLIVLPEEPKEYAIGEPVEVLLLPYL